MINYLKRHYWRGVKTSPLRAWRVSLLAALLTFTVSLVVGFLTGLLEFNVLDSNVLWIMPFVLFVFPSFLEESLFRGLLIPNDAQNRGRGYIISITLFSAIIFVIWHPLNALTINPGARVIFTDPFFLLIAFFLGIACAISYIYSRSLWSAVLIHWVTVVVWVIFLGGRNLVLE